MGIRLVELVCQDCGYFMALDAPAAETHSAQGTRVAAAPVYNAGRRGIASYDNSHLRAGLLQLEKQVIVSFSFLSMALGNYLLNPLFQLESMEVYSFKQLFFAGLCLAGLAALALFIDWRGFKQLALGVVCLVVVINLWPLQQVAQLKTQLILYKFIVDELVLVWFTILLYREILRTR